MNEELVVLYEDNHIIVVVKPHNMPTQEDSSKDRDLLTAIKDYIKTKYDKPGEAFVGLVHRLDRPTAGVMVFAKTSKAAARLTEQMKEGEFEKKYLAVVVGTPRDRRSRLTNYLVKDEANNMVKIAPAMIEGAKKAVLDYNTLESAGQISLVDVKLITGRSHQARVQLMGIGCPIYGDAKYGGDSLKKGANLALFAYSLRFVHPTTKEIMAFKVFPPVENSPWKFFNVQKHINVVRPD